MDIIDDMAIEGPHSFTVSIFSDDSAIVIGSPSSAVVSIIDNDGNTLVLFH